MEVLVLDLNIKKYNKSNSIKTNDKNKKNAMKNTIPDPLKNQ